MTTDAPLNHVQKPQNRQPIELRQCEGDYVELWIGNLQIGFIAVTDTGLRMVKGDGMDPGGGPVMDLSADDDFSIQFRFREKSTL